MDGHLVALGPADASLAAARAHHRRRDGLVVAPFVSLSSTLALEQGVARVNFPALLKATGIDLHNLPTDPPRVGQYSA